MRPGGQGRPHSAADAAPRLPHEDMRIAWPWVSRPGRDPAATLPSTPASCAQRVLTRPRAGTLSPSQLLTKAAVLGPWRKVLVIFLNSHREPFITVVDTDTWDMCPGSAAASQWETCWAWGRQMGRGWALLGSGSSGS